MGRKWEEVEKELFTPEEIAASDLRVAIMGILIKAKKAGISLEQVETITRETFEENRAFEMENIVEPALA